MGGSGGQGGYRHAVTSLFDGAIVPPMRVTAADWHALDMILLNAPEMPPHHISKALSMPVRS